MHGYINPLWFCIGYVLVSRVVIRGFEIKTVENSNSRVTMQHQGVRAKTGYVIMRLTFQGGATRIPSDM